jgi:hypothetical protein
MKRFIVLIILTTAAHCTWAQKEVSVTATTSNFFAADASPFSFTEPVKIIVDVSGVPALAGVEPLYMWAFINGCCGAPTNGDWNSSNEANRMTKVSPNVWYLTIPSVKSFMGASYKQAKEAAVSSGRTEQETRFGFLIKAKDGGGSPEKKTGDINVPFTGPIYIKQKFENFPTNPAKDDVVTFVYNQDLEDVEAMKTVTDVYAYAIADLTGGGTVIANPSKLTKNGTRYAISMIPEKFFELTSSQSIDRIRVVMGAENPAINFGSEKTVNVIVVK